MLLAAVSDLLGINQANEGPCALQALKPALLGEAAAARLDRQLAQLQRRLAAGAAGWGGAELPTAQQLQVAWHGLSLVLASADVPGIPEELELSGLAEEAARGLLQLEPDNPRSSWWLGRIAVMNHT